MSYNYHVSENTNISEIFFQKTKELNKTNMKSHDDWYDEENDNDHPFESNSKLKLETYITQTSIQKILHRIFRLFK